MKPKDQNSKSVAIWTMIIFMIVISFVGLFLGKLIGFTSADEPLFSAENIFGVLAMTAFGLLGAFAHAMFRSKKDENNDK